MNYNKTEIEIVKKLLKELEAELPQNNFITTSAIKEFIKEEKKKYNILPKYPTLREYINEHSHGAYHKFEFEIDYRIFKVWNVDEFERYYNESLLDKFVVIDDNTESYGDNCCNYECIHHLKVERK